jgi:hypothetical protein
MSEVLEAEGREERVAKADIVEGFIVSVYIWGCSTAGIKIFRSF